MSEKKDDELGRISPAFSSHIETIGVDFVVKTVQANDGLRVKLQIWRILTKDRFRYIRPIWFKDAMGLLIWYYAKRYRSDTYGASHLREIIAEFDNIRGTGLPKILVIFGADSTNDLPPAKTESEARLIASLPTNLPDILSEDEKRGLTELVRGTSNIKVMEAIRREGRTITLILTQIASDLMEWSKAHLAQGEHTSSAGKSAYDALFKIVLIGSERGGVFDL